jgi:succinate dehydrogenase / fumarate reductase, iron-sulfur subunit
MNRDLELKIRRTHGWQTFIVNLPEEAFLLDAIEEAWRQDNSLLFRHACHHASCGSCGIRVNGRERLACDTPLKLVSPHGELVRVEPLRNLPLVGDLLVELQPLYLKIEKTGLSPIRPVENLEITDDENSFQRFENCIECGLCISACPICSTSTDYFGPAALAAACRVMDQGVHGSIFASIDSEDGVWRCHSAFECGAVCPSAVEPDHMIMKLRQRILLHKTKDQK